MALSRRGFFGAVAATLAASMVGVAPALARRALRAVPLDRAAALRSVVFYPWSDVPNKMMRIGKVASFAELTTVWGRSHTAISAGMMVVTDLDVARDVIKAKLENARESNITLWAEACERGYWEEPIGDGEYKRIPFTDIRFIEAV